MIWQCVKMVPSSIINCFYEAESDSRKRELLTGDPQSTGLRSSPVSRNTRHRRHVGTDNASVSGAGLNGDVSNDEHSISSDAAADLTQDGDSMDSEREALNLVSG